MELHKKLEYVNDHQKCELKQSQGQLEQCRKELLEARVKINCEKESSHAGGDSTKTGHSNHELRMVPSLQY